jgi:hypothetical protein
VGTVAPTDEKRVLADELGQARVLIDQREFVAALDRLERVRDAASAQRDTGSLNDVRELARTVGRRVPPGTAVAGHADALALSVTWDLDPDGAEGGRHASRRQPVPLFAWLVGAAFVGAAIWIGYEVDTELTRTFGCGWDLYGGRSEVAAGGPGRSGLLWAAAIGGALWLISGVVAALLSRGRLLLLFTYALGYVLILVLLDHVVWASRCIPG